MGSIPLGLTTAVRYSPTNPAPWPSNRWIFNGYPFPSGTLPFRLVPSHPAQLRQHDGNGAVICLRSYHRFGSPVFATARSILTTREIPEICLETRGQRAIESGYARQR